MRRLSRYAIGPAPGRFELQFLLAIRQRNAPECAHKISNVLGACLEHIPSPCFGRIFRVIRPNPAVVGYFCNGAHQRNFNALKSHGLKACGLSRRIPA